MHVKHNCRGHLKFEWDAGTLCCIAWGGLKTNRQASNWNGTVVEEIQ